MAGMVIWGSATARADAVLLTFEGLGYTGLYPCVERVAGFYNGGLGGGGCGYPAHGPGPDWGIVFSDNSLALIDADAGGNGNFGGEPSPDTALFFNPTGPAIMNVAGGFTGSLGLYYAAPDYAGELRVYGGLNGTGPLLGALSLPRTPAEGAPDPTGYSSPLLPAQLLFHGRGRSAVFDGVPNHILFDNVMVNLATPTPEPATLLLVGGALVAVGRRIARNSRVAR